VGFFFGERLHKELDVPIGLIASSWGGSEIRSWMPPESFSMFEYTEKEAAQVALDASKSPQASPQLKAIDPKGKKLSTMFNGMIVPLIPYAMRGVIWYQGESNGADGMGYRDMVEAMLTSWRDRWGGRAFPFYYVQICSFFWYGTDYHLLDMWEAQKACLKIPNTGMVGTSDISQPWTWHPRNKLDVGNRLALWALAKDYPSTELRAGGKAADLIYCGPMYRSVKFQGNKAIIAFDHAGEGLKSLNGKPLTHFMLSGNDKRSWIR
jgi:sialate O-acetylesterase